MASEIEATSEILPSLDVHGVDRPASAAARWRGALARIAPYWTLTVVSLFGVMAWIDRGGLPLVVNAIRADLRLSDMQMGVILGFGQTVVTAALLMPAGYLADRFSRRGLLALSSVVWSVLAGLSCFAGGFFSLFTARAGLAGAEATLQPTAHSLLRDAFPPKERGMPFSIYWAASAVGVSVSLIVCGLILTWGAQGVFKDIPVIGHLKTWRIVLAAPGLCTLPLALLMLTIKEPKRGAHDGAAAEARAQVTLREFVQFLARNNWLFWPSIAYNIFWALQYYGVDAWQPTALDRGWGISPAEVAKVTGAIGLVTSLAGLLGGGWLVDHLGKRGIGDGAIKVCFFASAFAAAFQIGMYYVQPHWLIFTFIGVQRLCQGTINASYYVAISFVTPSRYMGRMIALQFFSLYVPYAFSPVLIAWASTTLFAAQGALGIIPAIELVLWVFSIAFLLMLGLWTLRVGKFWRDNPDGAA